MSGYPNLMGCGGCSNNTTPASKYSCLKCGRMLCGECGEYCKDHRVTVGTEIEQNGETVFAGTFGCDPDEDRPPFPMSGFIHVQLPFFHWNTFIENHQKDDAFYKIGTRVRYIGTNVPELEGMEFVIDASNIQDDESTEYHLEGFPYLVWGDEIQPVEIRPDDCHCLDSTFQALGCMCKFRRTAWTS